MPPPEIRLGVDVGGTFTDVVLVSDGAVTTAKVPSTPSNQQSGVLEGIARACDVAGVAPAAIDTFRHGTTVATNALLADEGAPTALVTTAGFRDVIEIGRQDRPALYDLSARKPVPLVPRAWRFEIDERATPDGIEREVRPAEVREVARAIPDGVQSVAICLLFAYAHPANEQQVATILREELDATVTASHEVLGAFREYERTSTTAADAAVTPIIDAYLGGLVHQATEQGLPTPSVMQSNGGIAETATVREHAITTALSGPAAGVVGASLFDPPEADGLVSFDMGGTSTDVGLVRGGEVERTTGARIGGHPIGLSMVDVESVGAGGGSIAWVDPGGALRVGPESAGADPGPASYGHGGDEPTVTDACLALGYLADGAVLGADVTLDGTAADAVMADLAAAAGFADACEAAIGVYRVAAARMAQAIRTVTVERGHDPRQFHLVAFGGAGPMFAAALADRLGIESVLVPRANGVLSAVGLLAADEQHDAVRTHRTILDEADGEAIEATLSALTTEVRDAASDPDAAEVVRRADCRYAGQSHELTVPVGNPVAVETLAEHFHTAHDRARGYRLADEPVELVSLRATARIDSPSQPLTHSGTSDSPTDRRSTRFDQTVHDTPVYRRDSLATGTTIAGPAICEGGESTVVVPPDWNGRVDARGSLRLEEST